MQPIISKDQYMKWYWGIIIVIKPDRSSGWIGLTLLKDRPV